MSLSKTINRLELRDTGSVYTCIRLGWGFFTYVYIVCVLYVCIPQPPLFAPLVGVFNNNNNNNNNCVINTFGKTQVTKLMLVVFWEILNFTHLSGKIGTTF